MTRKSEQHFEPFTTGIPVRNLNNVDLMLIVLSMIWHCGYPGECQYSWMIPLQNLGGRYVMSAIHLQIVQQNKQINAC